MNTEPMKIVKAHCNQCLHETNHFVVAERIVVAERTNSGREASHTDGKPLKGVVEIDETYIGGLEKNKHSKKKTKGTQGRSAKIKTAVVGMRSGSGQVKAKVMEKVSSKNIQRYINENVEEGSILATDESRFYGPVRGYAKIKVNHSISDCRAG